MTHPAKKVCFKCGEAKQIDEFYRHKAMSDGHLGKCKECTKRDVSANYRATQEPLRRAAALRYLRNRKRMHPEKFVAWVAVSNALRDGRLTKEPCKICGDEKVQAHHHDYSKPLDIEWLCFRCHRNERHGQSVQP
jgi:hypothetical protein